MTSRGLVDDDIDDLDLDVPADTGTEDASSTSAKPAASTSARKPAVRKTTANGNGNGNGRTSAARAKAKTAASAEATVTDGADKDDAADGVSADVSAETPSQDSVVADQDSAITVTEDKAPTQEMAAIDADLKAAASTDAAAVESAAADAGSAAVDGASPPAMPADEIWTQRTAKSTSKPVDDWAPVEASQRPYGNVYDVTDVYSAPPMPSDPYTTPAPSSTGRSSSTGRPSFTPSVPGPSVTRDAPPRGTASVPPTHAYPRPAGAAKPAPAPAPAAKTAAAAAAATAAKPATAAPKPKASVRRRSAGRQAHLTIARVEPWSVMKFSFATSLVAFVILFVAVAILYGILSALGVFTSLQHVVTNVTSSQNQSGYNAHTWFSASRVLTYTGLLGVLNVILITALCTIGSVVYNLTSKLMGGVEVTLKETD